MLMKTELKELVKLTKDYIEKMRDSGIKEISTDACADMKEFTLDEFRLKINKCRKCDISKTRTNFVFGEGNSKAELVFVGEAPGYEEDKQGRPFVGRAGQLLTKIIEAIGYRRDEVYICNVLKCRPPENRQPELTEIKNCMPYLIKQLSLLKRKKVICALGRYAAQSLLNLDMAMGKMRGQWYDFNGTPLMVTYHPAYLLRNPLDKRKVWADMKKVKECLQK